VGSMAADDDDDDDIGNSGADDSCCGMGAGHILESVGLTATAVRSIGLWNSKAMMMVTRQLKPNSLLVCH
jgi:hypothetical protein